MRNKILGMLLILGLLVPGLAFAQGTTVSGALTDADGEALIGANVIIKELNIGSSTDIEGNYSFEVPASNVGSTVTLVTAYVGYSSQERTVTLIAGAMTEDFVLNFDVLNLDEIVVTGVAVATPKKKLAFTVETISDELLEMAPAANPIAGLGGKVAGVQVVSASGEPGSGISVRMRGTTSLTGSSTPLYIVDGTILAASSVDLGSLDIQSIELVKGAAAASLYGSRAQNGVVQITTKRGSSTPINTTQVVIRNEFGVNQLTKEFVPNTSHNLRTDGTNFLDVDGNAVDYGAEAAIDETPEGASFVDNAYPGTQYNAFDEFFDPGNTYSNSIAISQNSNKTNFTASFENYREEGVITGSDGYGRRGLRLNLDHNISDRLKVSASTYYAQSTADDATNSQSDNPFFGIMFTSPAVSLTDRDENGDLYPQVDPLSVETNPLYLIENVDVINNRSRIMGNFNARYSPVSWFDMVGSLSFDRSDREYSEFFDKGFTLAGNDLSLVSGRILKQQRLNQAINADITGTVHRDFGAMAIRAQARYAIEDATTHSESTTGTGLVAQGNTDMSNVNGNKEIASFESIVRAEAYYGVLHADYDGKYIADLSIRRDGSSLFGSEERWQTYYRTAFAYRIVEEAYWDGLRDMVSDFKIRFSLGTAGARPGYELQYETYSLSNGNASKSTLGNVNLKPEHQTEQEFGVDLGFFEKVSLAVVYATSRVEDLLLAVPQPAPVGYSTHWQNAGTLESNTFEITLNANALQTRDMSLNFGVNFDRTRQDITELNVPAYKAGTNSAFYYREGEQIGAIYGSKFSTSASDLPTNYADYAEQFQQNDEGYFVPVGAGNSWKDGISSNLWGTTVFLDADSTIGVPWGMPVFFADSTGNQFTKIGNTISDFNIGFNTTFSFKGFRAYMLWNAQVGGDVYNATAQWAYRDDRHVNQDQAGRSDAVKKSTDYYQVLYAANATNSNFIEDGTYVKLREVTLEYSLNRDFLTSMLGNKVRGISVALSGRNLLTFTNYSGFDPEVGSGGDATLGRIDNFNYPNYRSFTGRLTIEF